MLLLFVLVGFVAAVVVGIVRLYSHFHRKRLEAEESIADANDLFSIRPDLTLRNEYNARRQVIFDQLLESKKWEITRLQEDMLGDAQYAWHRELTDEPLRELKSLLLRRAKMLIPYLTATQEEVQRRHRMYEAGLVSQKQWNLLMGISEVLSNETLEIKHEAECIAEGWGVDGQIFRQAAQIHQHEMKKKMEEMQAQAKQRYMAAMKS